MPDFHLKEIKKNYPYSDAAELFLIPTIRRCSEFAERGKPECLFALVRREQTEKVEVGMLVLWGGISSIPPQTAQEETETTEYAALGIAHLIFPGLIGKTIERTDRATGADYWVGGERETLLEVSGIYKGQERINSRIKEKEERLRNSPYFNGQRDNVDAFISVTHFEKRASVLKHLPKESHGGK